MARNSWYGIAANYYDIGVDNALLGNFEIAVMYLDSARQNYMYIDLINYDPAFDNLRNRDDFKVVSKKVNDFMSFRKEALTNALNRMEQSESLRRLLR